MTVTTSPALGWVYTRNDDGAWVTYLWEDHLHTAEVWWSGVEARTHVTHLKGGHRRGCPKSCPDRSTTRPA
jgi:hypothetical protein